MSRGGDTTYDKVLSRADDVADNILRHSKHYLPHLARLCLIATFLEDGLRMWFQWREQKDYINLTWRCGEFLGHMFVLVNMVFQLAGCVMVLIRRYVPVAVGLLFAVIVIQVNEGSPGRITCIIIVDKPVCVVAKLSQPLMSLG